MTTDPAFFGRYQVISRIGQGGMGILYLAWDPTLERKVAIKVLLQDNQDLRERFSREARSAARLRHRHIVTIYDVGENSGLPFMAMEYVEGQTFADIIRNREPLSVIRKLQLAQELGEGLAYAHKAGVIHRDVKPSNVMVDAGGSAKILDFGVARLGDAAGLTQDGAPVGTLNYMSPEQLAGRRVDNRSDVFAFGAVLYELLSFRQAFPGSLATGILQRILHSERVPLDEAYPGINPEIVQVVDRALESDVAKRYQDLAAAARDLERIRLRLIADGETSATMTLDVPPPVAEERPPTPVRGQTPRRTVDHAEIARRRASQIQEHLAAARDAFGAGDFDAGIAACERALILDAEEPTALHLLDHARTELNHRQAEQWLTEAERELQRGSVTAALVKVDQAEALEPASARAAQVRELAHGILRERERARQRAEAVREALAAGQTSFDRGKFQDAVSAADSALAIDGGLTEAVSLKTRAMEALEAEAREALARRVRDGISEARRLFSTDQHDAAISLLSRFDPQTPLIVQARGELQEQQRRIEAERLAKQRRIQEELAAARQAIDDQDFLQAIDRLQQLASAEGDSPDIAQLIDEAQRGQAELERSEEIARNVAEHVARAAGLLARNDLTAATSRVEAALALDPRHAAALSLRGKIQDAVRIESERRNTEVRRNQERAQKIAGFITAARQARSHEAAIAVIEDALQLDSEHVELRALLQQHRSALAREQDDRRRLLEAEQQRRDEIANALREARRALDSGELQAAGLAIARVRSIEPQHPQAIEMANALAELERERLRAKAKPRPSEPVAEPPPQAPAPVVRPRVDAPTPGPSQPVSPSVPPPAPWIPKRTTTDRRLWYAVLPVAGIALAAYLVVRHQSLTSPLVDARLNPPPTAPATAPHGSTAAPEVPPPVAQAPPAEAPTSRPDPEQRLADLRRQARAQYARGDRAQALDSMSAGLSLKPQDAELRSLLDRALSDARGEARPATASSRTRVDSRKPGRRPMPCGLIGARRARSGTRRPKPRPLPRQRPPRSRSPSRRHPLGAPLPSRRQLKNRIRHRRRSGMCRRPTRFLSDRSGRSQARRHLHRHLRRPRRPLGRRKHRNVPRSRPSSKPTRRLIRL